MLRIFFLLLMGVLTSACVTSVPIVSSNLPNFKICKIAAQRITAIVVTDKKSINEWVGNRKKNDSSLQSFDGGSATPISFDGYFLTADHVLRNSIDKNIFIIRHGHGKLYSDEARIVWRDRKADVAILHVRKKTPEYYQFTPTDLMLPVGTPIFHAGVISGLRSLSGRLTSHVPKQLFLSHPNRFSINIPLVPGDSGGPILTADGNLIGINSAVEYIVPIETPIFTESFGSRPAVSKIFQIIAKDRTTTK
jgi:S1-C subfamily serine protease